MAKTQNLSLWILSLALQCLLSFGLILFWAYEGASLRDPLPRATDETVQLQLKKVNDQEARAIIAGQQIRTRTLLHARETAHTFIGYMAILSVSGAVITLLLLVISFARKGSSSLTLEQKPGTDHG